MQRLLGRYKPRGFKLIIYCIIILLFTCRLTRQSLVSFRKDLRFSMIHTPLSSRKTLWERLIKQSHVHESHTWRTVPICLSHQSYVCTYSKQNMPTIKSFGTCKELRHWRKSQQTRTSAFYRWTVRQEKRKVRKLPQKLKDYIHYIYLHISQLSHNWAAIINLLMGNCYI